jgi:signal transduction histidine kinase
MHWLLAEGDRVVALRRIGRLTRAGLLLACAVLAGLGSPLPHRWPTAAVCLVVLAAVGVVAAHRPGPTTRGRVGLFAEALVWGAMWVAVSAVDGAPAAFLMPYLLAPALMAGITDGPAVATAVPLVACAVASSGDALPLRAATGSPLTAGLLELAVAGVGMTVGVGAAAARRLATSPPVTTERSVQDAHRLLTQLRLVARRLPGTLDPTTLAEGLLFALAETVAFDRAAVLVASAGERLVPVVIRGSDRLEWPMSVRGDSPLTEAWLSQEPQWSQRQLSRSPGSSRGLPGSAVVLPLRTGARTYGLVGLETARPGLTQAADLTRLQAVVDEVALQLETALLFDEVRQIATQEERRRLAREIHDGIAQELAGMGYALDSLAAESDERVQVIAGSLRADMTRLVHELRMSIFELRNEADRHGGLGAALSEYVRSIGTTTDLTVHLTLDEAPQRLPAATEAEVLRIAQEAINNARRHADARNLWVTLTVVPPYTRLVVEDDGRGFEHGADETAIGGVGLNSMRERAQALRGRLRVVPREPDGTVVELVVHDPVPATMGSSATSAPRRTAEEDPWSWPSSGAEAPLATGTQAGAGRWFRGGMSV